MSQQVYTTSSQVTGRLVVPVGILRVLPDGARFEPELTDEGILYRFVGITEKAVTPDWAKNGADAG